MKSRRDVLQLGIGAAAFGVSAAGDPVRADEPTTPTLRELAASRGLIFGAAAVSRDLKADPTMVDIYQNEVGVLVPDLELKWTFVHPSKDSYSFDGSDFLADFCQAHGLKLRGHNLAWEESNPDWLKATITRKNAEHLLTDHIRHVAGRYAGRVHSWDVVNEPIWPDHGKPNGLRDGVWLQTLGPRYIDIAFHTARAVDPKAMLVLNEAATETRDPQSLRRRRLFIDLLDRLKRDGVPVDAVGLECHMAADGQFDERDFEGYLGELSGRGYKIMITELDVADEGLPDDIERRDAAVARIYHRVVSTALGNRNVIAVITWELSDRYSWMRDTKPPDEKENARRSPRPLPFDAEWKRKKCYYALARAFSQAAPRI